MIKYRGLGYTLEDSMATYHEFKDLSELIKYIQFKNPRYKYFKIVSYDNNPDKRIGWKHTNVIMAATENKIYYPQGFVCIKDEEVTEDEQSLS